MDTWVERSVYDIWNENSGGIFDSYDPATRAELSIEELYDLPIYDNSGQEIPIYTDNGYVIERHLPTLNHISTPCGILADLRDLSSLFTRIQTDGFFAGDEEVVVPYHVYPQAGLVTAGHFQAQGLITPFYPLIDKLNASLRQQRGEDDEGDEMMHSTISPVIGIASQGYNAIIHSTRGHSAQHHDAQRGLVTAALSGIWATGSKNITKAEKLRSKCDTRFPHADYEDKIKRPGICRDFRLENVYAIDVSILAHGMKNGK